MTPASWGCKVVILGKHSDCLHLHFAELNIALCCWEFFFQYVVLSVSMIFPSSLAALWTACLVCVCAVGSDSWSDMDYTLYWHVLWGTLNVLLSVSVSFVTQISCGFLLAADRPGLPSGSLDLVSMWIMPKPCTVYMHEFSSCLTFIFATETTAVEHSVLVCCYWIWSLFSLNPSQAWLPGIEQLCFFCPFANTHAFTIIFSLSQSHVLFFSFPHIPLCCVQPSKPMHSCPHAKASKYFCSLTVLITAAVTQLFGSRFA